MNKLNEKAVEGLIAVQKTARTNMFDLATVAVIANELEYYETVLAIHKNKRSVAHFILTGQNGEGEK